MLLKTLCLSLRCLPQREEIHEDLYMFIHIANTLRFGTQDMIPMSGRYRKTYIKSSATKSYRQLKLFSAAGLIDDSYKETNFPSFYCVTGGILTKEGIRLKSHFFTRGQLIKVNQGKYFRMGYNHFPEGAQLPPSHSFHIFHFPSPEFNPLTTFSNLTHPSAVSISSQTALRVLVLLDYGMYVNRRSRSNL